MPANPTARPDPALPVPHGDIGYAPRGPPANPTQDIQEGAVKTTPSDLTFRQDARD